MLIAAGFALLFGDMLSSASAPDEFVEGQLVYPLLDLAFVAFALVLAYAGRLRLGPSYYAVSVARRRRSTRTRPPEVTADVRKTRWP